MEWNLGATIWKKSVLAIDEILKVLNEACIQRVKINFAMDHSQKSVVFVYSQIF